MPELPDVEAFKEYLEKNALDQQIERVEIKDKKTIQAARKTLKDALEGKKLKKAVRIGKHLLVRSSSGKWLALHFGMTGYLDYFKNGKELPKHSRMVIHFKNDHHLAYVNQRKFGWVEVTDSPDEYKEDKDLGPDASDISLNEFKKIFKSKKGKIKTALMDQKLLAGIGNVYADEILYQARLHPEINLTKLSEEDLKTLHSKMKQVWKTTIKHHADPDKFPKNYLTPNRKKGGNCPKCPGKIEKIEVNGRGTYYCPSCQRKQ